MKHKKWLFPILSAAVASVAVVVIWNNVERTEPVETTVVTEPSGETVIQSAHFIFIASSIEDLTAEADAIVIGTGGQHRGCHSLSRRPDYAILLKASTASWLDRFAEFLWTVLGCHRWTGPASRYGERGCGHWR